VGLVYNRAYDLNIIKGVKLMGDVSILMGSQSEWKVMKREAERLDELGISNKSRIMYAQKKTAK